MTKMVELIEKIEGEAKLHFSFLNNKIDFVNIEFLSTRNIETILKNKNALDALVINPRVCGICGHAHLLATVQALEDCYDEIIISSKAKILRELTLNFELIQNHFKWFYLTILPLFGHPQYVLKASKPSALMAKAIAVFGGQYPHNSYAIVGGVVSEPTYGDILKVETILDETILMFEEFMVQAKSGDFLECTFIDKIFSLTGDLPMILKEIKNNNWQTLGKSYDRFICFSENSYFKSGKSSKTRVNKNISFEHIEEFSNQNSFAKNVKYKNKYYEVGPLARAIINKTPLIKDAHRKYGDSVFSRILARVCEIPQLLHHSKKLLKSIELSEPSFIKPKIAIGDMSGFGCSAVEAARGSLIHKVSLKQGMIENYEIITPTQWNLSNGTKEDMGISQKSMIGLENKKTAEIIFKSFDVCSVCTTH